jgi:hypothetical protein
MLHEELPPHAPFSHFGFLQLSSVSLGETGATATGISETSVEQL